MRNAIPLVGVVLLVGTASLALAEAGADPVTDGDYSQRVAILETALTDVVDGTTTEESGSYVDSDESVAHSHAEECVAHLHSEEEWGDHSHPEGSSYVGSDESVAHSHAEECVAHSHAEESGSHSH